VKIVNVCVNPVAELCALAHRVATALNRVSGESRQNSSATCPSLQRHLAYTLHRSQRAHLLGNAFQLDCEQGFDNARGTRTLCSSGRRLGRSDAIGSTDLSVRCSSPNEAAWSGSGGSSCEPGTPRRQQGFTTGAPPGLNGRTCASHWTHLWRSAAPPPPRPPFQVVGSHPFAAFVQAAEVVGRRRRGCSDAPQTRGRPACQTPARGEGVAALLSTAAPTRRARPRGAGGCGNARSAGGAADTVVLAAAPRLSVAQTRHPRVALALHAAGAGRTWQRGHVRAPPPLRLARRPWHHPPHRRTRSRPQPMRAGLESASPPLPSPTSIGAPCWPRSSPGVSPTVIPTPLHGAPHSRAWRSCHVQCINITRAGILALPSRSFRALLFPLLLPTSIWLCCPPTTPVSPPPPPSIPLLTLWPALCPQRGHSWVARPATTPPPPMTTAAVWPPPMVATAAWPLPWTIMAMRSLPPLPPRAPAVGRAGDDGVWWR